MEFKWPIQVKILISLLKNLKFIVTNCYFSIRLQKMGEMKLFPIWEMVINMITI